MRSTLITSVLAAAVLSVGVAATAGAADSGGGGGGGVAAPTTVPFNLDSLGLTPEQMNCLMSNAATVDLQDMAAIMDVMTQCGINPMDLATGATPTVPGVATTVPPALPVVPGAVDPAAASAVLAMLGVDPGMAKCIETGLLAAVSPGDDNEALAIMQSCGLTLNALLTGLVAVNAAAAGAVLPVVPTVVPTVPGLPTTVSGATAGPLVQQLIDMVQQQYGVTLTPEQASCLLDNISTVDPEDVNQMLVLMEQCGISLSDLVPS